MYGRVILLSCIWILPGCFESTAPTDNDSIVCTQVYVYGATVVVTEAGTSTPITNATVTAVSNAGQSAEPFVGQEGDSAGTYIGLGEAPGTWTITTSAPGFESDTQTVMLEMDEAGCHVVGQTLTFELQSLPN
jgi:hypothetical protein